MAKGRKFPPEMEATIAKEYIAGLSQDKLCIKYDTCRPVIARILREHGAKKPVVMFEKRSIVEFESRAKSVLWRQEPGRDENRKSYNSWMEKVKTLQSPEGAGYTHAQAVVQASKDYPCLNRFFREYDLSAFDPNPESHPQIRQIENLSGNESNVVCEGKTQSYRDSLRWAIDAAGAFLRTGLQPKMCPCDTAWYLYQQAISEPKDFLAKIGQIESKNSFESEDDISIRKSGKRSIAELNSMLTVLEEEING